jgi:hypothetical protein
MSDEQRHPLRPARASSLTTGDKAPAPQGSGVHHGVVPGSVSPFRSAESFETYCHQVQARLAEHAANRRHFLQEACDRLARLFQAARDVEDTALCNELRQHLLAARELLDALNRHAGPLSHLADSPLASGPERYAIVSAPAPPVTSRASGSGASRHEDSPMPGGMPELPTGSPSLYHAPRHYARPLPDIEADAIRLRAEIRDWNARFPLIVPSGELHASNCLRLRAVACRQRRLEAEAGEMEVAEVIELHNDIVALLDAADDQEYTVALDYELKPGPNVYQWGELAERYEEMAHAWDVYEWWVQHKDRLSVADVQPMVEAIAATQQRFNRLLFRVGARDPFQQQLFDELRHWAREAQCYLHSLRPKVPIQELIERASTLDSAWEQARASITEKGSSPEPPSPLTVMVAETVTTE